MIAAILLAAAVETAHGTWNITMGKSEMVLETRWHSDDYRHEEDNGRAVDPNAVGIAAALKSSGQHATFTIHRDAGDLVFDGWFGNGTGAGNFTYTPNEAFFTALQKRGYAVDGIAEEMSFATLDVSNDYISSLEGLGYKTDARGLRELRSMNVTPEYITQMRAAGITADDARSLTEMKAVGVAPDYVRTMKSAGLQNLDRRSLVELKSMNVTPAFISEIAQAGYPHLTAREYVELKSMNIDAAYIRSLANHGLKDLTIRRIVELKSMGVN